jgi:hypothetical protein
LRRAERKWPGVAALGVGHRIAAMFYQDLSTECQVDSGQHIRAVGWLGKRAGLPGLFGAKHPFTVGEVDPGFVERLREHIRNAWQPVVAMGCHSCEFCGNPQAKGCRNVWIPTRSLIYVAPELIVHYIDVHCYLPPREFVNAVMQCPPQKSAEFFRLLSAFKDWWSAQPHHSADGSQPFSSGTIRESLAAGSHR